MKIFNWVHRKFHQNSNGYVLSHKNDGLAYDVKKPAETTVTNEADTEALLDQVTDLIDVWKDGILTIGTFGYDPLKPNSDKQIEYSVVIKQQGSRHDIEEEEDDDDDDDEEEEEEEETGLDAEEEHEEGYCRRARNRGEGRLNPLVVKAFKREIEKVLGSNSNTDTVGTKPDTIRITVDETDMPLLPFFESPEVLKSESDEKEKKKRMTLADLFSAEPNVVMNGKTDSGQVVLQADSGKKPACPTKNNGLSFAKKLMPRKGEDSRPIRKIHRMITKMLKKKIHPELEGKVQGKDGSKAVIGNNSILPETCTHKPSHGNATMESVSLLREVVTQC